MDYTNIRFSICDKESGSFWSGGIIQEKYDDNEYKFLFDTGGFKYYTIQNDETGNETFAIEKETKIKHQVLLGDNVAKTPKSYSVYIQRNETSSDERYLIPIICRSLGSESPTIQHPQRWQWPERGWPSEDSFQQNLAFGMFSTTKIQILKRGTKIEAEQVRDRLHAEIGTSCLNVECIEEPCGYPLSSDESKQAGDLKKLAGSDFNPAFSSSSQPFNYERAMQMTLQLRAAAEAGDERAIVRLNTLREYAEQQLISAQNNDSSQQHIAEIRSLLEASQLEPSVSDSTPSSLRQTSFSEFSDMLEEISPELSTWLQNPPTGKIPTSEKAISHMKQSGKVIKSQEEAMDFETCCICMSDFQVGDVATKLPTCSHVFHLEAHNDCLGLKTWLETHDTCPICRQEITVESKPSIEESSGPSRKRMAQARQMSPLDDDGTYVCGGCYTEVRGTNGIEERCPCCDGTNAASRQAFQLERTYLRKVVVCARLLEELGEMHCLKTRDQKTLDTATNERERLMHCTTLKMAMSSNWRIKRAVQRMLYKTGKKREFTNGFYMDHDPNTRVVLKRLWEMWKDVSTINSSGINKNQSRHFPVNGIASYEFGQITTWDQIFQDIKKKNAKMNAKMKVTDSEFFLLENTAAKLKNSGFTFRTVVYDDEVLEILQTKCFCWPEKKLGGVLDFVRMLVLTNSCIQNWGVTHPEKNAGETKENHSTASAAEVVKTTIRALKCGKKLPEIMALRTACNMLRNEPIARSIASCFNAVSTSVLQVATSKHASNPMVYESIRFLVRNVATTFSQGLVPDQQVNSVVTWMTILLKYYDGSLSMKLTEVEGDVLTDVFRDFVAIGTLLSSVESLSSLIVEPVRAVTISVQEWAKGIKNDSIKLTHLCETCEDILQTISTVERIIVSNEGNDASLYDDDDSNKDDSDSEVD